MVGRGLVFMLKGEHDKALAEYDRAVEASPKETNGYLGRGMVYGQQGKIDKALAEYDRALAINPKQPDALAERGVALLVKGRTAEASADFDHALEVNPEHVGATVGRGIVMMATGQIERALVAFDQAIDRGTATPSPIWCVAKRCWRHDLFRKPVSTFRDHALLGGREAENPAGRIVGEDPERAIRALAHVANALAQLPQQALLFDHLVAVEFEPRQELTGERAHEQIAAPSRKQIAGIKRHARGRDRGHPVPERLLHAFL